MFFWFKIGKTCQDDTINEEDLIVEKANEDVSIEETTTIDNREEIELLELLLEFTIQGSDLRPPNSLYEGPLEIEDTTDSFLSAEEIDLEEDFAIELEEDGFITNMKELINIFHDG